MFFMVGMVVVLSTAASMVMMFLYGDSNNSYVINLNHFWCCFGWQDYACWTLSLCSSLECVYNTGAILSVIPLFMKLGIHVSGRCGNVDCFYYSHNLGFRLSPVMCDKYALLLALIYWDWGPKVGATGWIWPKNEIVGLYYLLILLLSPENSTL